MLLEVPQGGSPALFSGVLGPSGFVTEGAREGGGGGQERGKERRESFKTQKCEG